jgi:hypothetical protein
LRQNVAAAVQDIDGGSRRDSCDEALIIGDVVEDEGYLLGLSNGIHGYRLLDNEIK